MIDATIDFRQVDVMEASKALIKEQRLKKLIDRVTLFTFFDWTRLARKQPKVPPSNLRHFSAILPC